MRNESYGKSVFDIIKGAALALAISFLLAVIFANILRFARLSNGVIYPINQCIKAVCIAVGTLVCIRGEKGWLRGGCVGLVFTALSYLAFSAIGGDFSTSWLIIAELFCAFLTGALSGILAVNCKERR